MIVLKIEEWPQGIVTAREIGRCFIVPMEPGSYSVMLDYPFRPDKGFDVVVKSDDDNPMAIAALAFEESKNIT
jgi:hypothetical protein